MKKLIGVLLGIILITGNILIIYASDYGNLMMSVTLNENLLISLYDFEEGTTQGWVNDTSGDFLDNLDVPTNSTENAQDSTHSLCYALDLDTKDPILNYINDTGYVRPPSGLDLSTARGISLYIYIPDTADISPSTPATGSVYVKTGSGWNLFENNEMASLSLGVWNKITLDFLSAKNSSGQVDQVVTGLNTVQEIGVHISGAATSSGITFLYVDSVGAIGEEQIVLSVEIAGSYDFGILGLGAEAISDQPFTVTNSGNITETFYLNLVDPSGWTAVQTNPGDETYVLNAMFNSIKPLQASFIEANHALSIIPRRCTGTKFAGDQNGVAVSSSDTRSLWVEFRAPMMTTIATPQAIRLIVIAEAS